MMLQVIAIVGLMFFTWIVAVYATVKEESPQEKQPREHHRAPQAEDKAA